ncbi:halovibrin HvnC [Pseudomonas sp. SWRI99]|uniref:halovibrin HvnC n=1 Tax=Pseudomonas sp. SWRI99 TaxID=2745506 RepID=UPI0016450A45|nr:halovibrin HvnC [Pseudomonas sp. SWRI99]MBC3778304.1 halovibrin HvnC [Pseudomonas sp. SWRI99]
MRTIIASLLVALLLGCSQSPSQLPEVTNSSGTLALDGPATAAYLTTLYARKFPNCNKVDSQPSFLCSGVMLRVTVKDPANAYKVWEPSPISTTSGGVSFSYLRADTNFGRLAWGYGNGYILYPVLERPATTDQLLVLCSYPMDSWGWHRGKNGVCIPSPSYPESGYCHTANVTTAEQFKAAWDRAPDNKNLRQCAFDVRDERNTLAAPAFYQSLRAKGMLGAVGFNEHNEVIIKTWLAGRANTFPILAFFYISGGSDPKPLADAKYNQRDFYNSTNPKRWVPIIRLLPPNSATGTATFTYVATDQEVTQ